MSRKPTKKQLQKLAQELKPHLIGKTKWDWKSWLGIGLAILGLVLGALGLQVKPTVSLEPPTSQEDILTTPVEISNDGIFLAMKNVEVSTFLVKVGYSSGNLTMEDIGVGYTPPGETLEAGDRQTVSFHRLLPAPKDGSFVIKADIALVVSFTPEYLPFWKRTKVFRFIAVPEGKNRLRFQPQPASNVLQEYEKTRERLDNLQRQFQHNAP